MVTIPFDFYPNLTSKWETTTLAGHRWVREDCYRDGGEDRYGSGHEEEIEEFLRDLIWASGNKCESIPFSYCYPEIAW